MSLLCSEPSLVPHLNRSYVTQFHVSILTPGHSTPAARALQFLEHAGQTATPLHLLLPLPRIPASVVGRTLKWPLWFLPLVSFV